MTCFRQALACVRYTHTWLHQQRLSATVASTARCETGTSFCDLMHCQLLARFHAFHIAFHARVNFVFVFVSVHDEFAVTVSVRVLPKVLEISPHGVPCSTHCGIILVEGFAIVEHKTGIDCKLVTGLVSATTKQGHQCFLTDVIRRIF